MPTITIDEVNGVPGTTFPIGTPIHPVNNMADAKSIMEEILENKYARDYDLNPVLYWTLGYSKDEYVKEMIKEETDPDLKAVFKKIMNNRSEMWYNEFG